MLPAPAYDDGRVTLYQGDCRELLPLVLERHGRPAHVFTDPPYTKRTHEGARTLRGGGDPKELIDFANAEIDFVREVFAAARPQRWTVASVDHVHATLLQLSPPEGMRHVRTGVWIKPDCAPQMNGKHPANGHESIAILHTHEPMRWNGGGERAVWTHNVERSIDWHTTPKPLGLIARLVRDFTDENELLLDMFAGSATTLAAAMQEGRRAVGIELDVHPKTVERLTRAAQQVPMWKPHTEKRRTAVLDFGGDS
ncbi:DNA-methyltransferase [Sandaracinus amylolyticus]|nr:site-specific DNA-methyltransferase [Sandaracinus amylolyticus]